MEMENGSAASLGPRELSCANPFPFHLFYFDGDRFPLLPSLFHEITSVQHGFASLVSKRTAPARHPQLRAILPPGNAWLKGARPRHNKAFYFLFPSESCVGETVRSPFGVARDIDGQVSVWSRSHRPFCSSGFFEPTVPGENLIPVQLNEVQQLNLGHLRRQAFGNKAVYRTAENFDADPGELLVERDVAFQNNDLIYDSIIIIFNPVIALPSLASTLCCVPRPPCVLKRPSPSPREKPTSHALQKEIMSFGNFSSAIYTRKANLAIPHPMRERVIAPGHAPVTSLTRQKVCSVLKKIGTFTDFSSDSEGLYRWPQSDHAGEGVRTK